MRLYSVRNGFIGNGQVAALVMANNEEEAAEIGSKALAADVASQSDYYDDDDREQYAVVQSVVEVTLPFVGDELP